jgi:hypothetical protein
LAPALPCESDMNGTTSLAYGKKELLELLLLTISGFCSCSMLASCAGSVSGSPTKPTTAPAPAQTTLPASVSIRDYGAIGDDLHDDSPAILAAVNAAFQAGINTVEFPPTTSYYLIGSPLVLPRPPISWMKLNLDGPLDLDATVTIGGFYSIHGDGSYGQGAFSQDAQELIAVEPSVNPAFNVVGNAVHFSDLLLYFHLGGDGDGILTSGACCITATNVSVNHPSSNGIGVHITGGGFDYIFEKGFYGTGGTGPTFQIDGPSNGNGTGALAMRDVVLYGGGVQLNVHGPMSNYVFENILFEGAQNAFLTINGTPQVLPLGQAYVFETRLDNVLIADPVGNPAPPLIVNNDASTAGFQVINTPIYSTVVSGDPIQDLEIWAGADVSVGQASEYVLHEPSGVFSTMPVGSVPPPATLSRRSTLSAKRFQTEHNQ